jgi:hypothetical protein
MADSGGHWKNLAEAQKLSTSTTVAGVVETDIKRNNPAKILPIFKGSGTGLSIKWLLEKTGVEKDVQNLTIGSQMSWSEGVEYTTQETGLTIKAVQRKLDSYVAAIYGTYNNYEAQMLLETKKGCMRKLGDAIIYDNSTYGVNQFDGMHAWAAKIGAPAAGSLNVDANGALSLGQFRSMADAGKLGWDAILMPFGLLSRLEASFQEKGFAGLASGTAGTMANVSWRYDDFGRRIGSWGSAMGPIPIIPTDYLVAEQDGTGTGSTADARAKWTSGTVTYSVFFLKFGNPLDTTNPGVAFAFGNQPGGDSTLIDEGFFELQYFNKLEDYIGKGIRLFNFGSFIASSPFALGRIFDITDAAITT